MPAVERSGSKASYLEHFSPRPCPTAKAIEGSFDDLILVLVFMDQGKE